MGVDPGERVDPAALACDYGRPMLIGARFNGPDGSGNGGYSAGVFAAAVAGDDDPVEVTLRRPPPLDVPLTVTPHPDGADIGERDGDLVAQVRRVPAFEAIVPPVSWAEATHASRDYPGFTDHPFPACYVCGPQRADGLRIFPGRLPDGRTAAPFLVPAEVDDPTCWAALDCPGGWAVLGPGRPYVLGRIAAVVTARPQPGAECVVTGRLVDVAGRKALVHSTLYDPAGHALAYARATWIAI